MKPNICMATILIAAVGASCATSPTGRKQLMLLPESQMAVMGAQAFQEMKRQVPTETDARWNEYVRCIAGPITQAAKEELEVKEWEIVVFKDKSANAFALPGGKIGVHTGIMEVAKTPAQLAAVVGHEVGHVIARHGNERVSQAVAAQGGLIAAGALTKDNPQRNLILGALGLGAQFGILLPHGRTQESEADEIGLKLMAEAGFDPRESIELWKDMKAANSGSPPEFLSTHPSHETRISNLSSKMDEAMRIYQEAQKRGARPACKKPT